MELEETEKMRQVETDAIMLGTDKTKWIEVGVMMLVGTERMNQMKTGAIMLAKIEKRNHAKTTLMTLLMVINKKTLEER
jgi:hypothetical protein